ncbi:MAG: hypothetical protein K8R53_09435 [Bacteroidales bacterium]|nr:hypothetical protein [Bacteroidales bacterium]
MKTEFITMPKVCFFLVLFFFSGMVVLGQSSLTLADAITRSLENNF